MLELKKKIARMGKIVMLLLRALTTTAIFMVMYQSGGQRNLVAALACAAVGCLLVYLCDFRVNGFGAAFGLLLEYYAISGSFTDSRIQLAMLAVSYILMFVSLNSQKRQKQNSSTP